MEKEDWQKKAIESKVERILRNHFVGMEFYPEHIVYKDNKYTFTKSFQSVICYIEELNVIKN